MKKSSSDLQYPDTSQFCFGLMNGQKLLDLQFPELYLNSVLFIMSCGDYITIKNFLKKAITYLVPNYGYYKPTDLSDSYVINTAMRSCLKQNRNHIMYRWMC